MWVENHRHPVEQIFIHVSVIVRHDPLILSNLPRTLTCTCPICHWVDRVTHHWAVSMSLLIKPTFSPPQSTRMCSNMAQLVAQSATGNLVQPRTPAPLKIYFFWEHVCEQWHFVVLKSEQSRNDHQRQEVGKSPITVTWLRQHAELLMELLFLYKRRWKT